MVKCRCFVLYNVSGGSVLSVCFFRLRKKKNSIKLCFIKTQGFELRPPLGPMKASLQKKLVSAVIAIII